MSFLPYKLSYCQLLPLSDFIRCTLHTVHEVCCVHSADKLAHRLLEIWHGLQQEIIVDTDALISLHWLRGQERILFKIAVTTYRAVNGSAPAYLSSITRDICTVALDIQTASYTFLFHLSYADLIS